MPVPHRRAPSSTSVSAVALCSAASGAQAKPSWVCAATSSSCQASTIPAVDAPVQLHRAVQAQGSKPNCRIKQAGSRGLGAFPSTQCRARRRSARQVRRCRSKAITGRTPIEFQGSPHRTPSSACACSQSPFRFCTFCASTPVIAATPVNGLSLLPPLLAVMSGGGCGYLRERSPAPQHGQSPCTLQTIK